MKTRYILISIVVALWTKPAPVQGQFAVAVVEQSVELMLTQRDILEKERERNNRLGDPSEWTQVVVLPGAGETITAFNEESVIVETAEFIEAGVLGDGVIGYDAGGLYDPFPGEVFTDEDEFVEVDMRQFKPNELIIKTVSNMLVTTSEARRRKEAVRIAMEITMRGIVDSTTEVQTQKLAPILAAQSAELLSIDKEVDTATSQMVAVSMLTKNYKDMAEKLKREERIANAQTALRRIDEFLSGETTAFRLPNQVRFP